MGNQLDAVNAQAAALKTKVADADSALKSAVSTRQSAIDAITTLLANPLGNGSDLTKALSDSSATASTIISQYNSLVKLVQDRFASITGDQQSTLVTYLKDQTMQLLDLVAQRDVIVTGLKDSQTALTTLLATKDTYASSLTKTLTDANVAMSMFVTSEGLVSTPAAMIQSFQTRLNTLKKFQSDVQALAARGVSQTIIDQITGMGSGNGDALASSLLTGSNDQIAALNASAQGINDTATALSTSLSDTFYDGAVTQAQKVVKGWTDQQTNINAKMQSISAGIAAQMAPLTNVMANLGIDSAQALLDSLNAQEPALVSAAKAIGAAMAKAVTDAMSAINALAGTNAFGVALPGSKGAAANLLAPPPPASTTKSGSGLTVGQVTVPVVIHYTGGADSQAQADLAAQVKAIAAQAVQDGLTSAAKASARVRDW
jgi:hypothetical protein